VLYISFDAMSVVLPDPASGVKYVCRIFHCPQSSVTSDSAPSHMCLLYTQSGIREPHYLQGRCDLSGAKPKTVRIAEHVKTTCHSFQSYDYRKLGPNGVYVRSSKSYSTYVRGCAFPNGLIT